MTQSTLDTQAVIRAVLAEAGKPLHYREIATAAVATGYWQSSVKNPEVTINAALSGSLRTSGETSPFLRVRKGVYSLRATTTPISAHTVEDGAKQSGFKVLSFLDAAEQVLKLHSGRQPMHYQAITAKALELRLIKTDSQSPEATMNAQISVDIDRQQKRGGVSRFLRHSRGHIALADWELGGLADQIRKQNEATRKLLQVRLLAMHPKDFEALIATLLTSLGVEDASVTDYHDDGGIDVRGTLVVGGSIETRMAVQVKRYKHNVQRPAVQQVRGSLGAHERGLIITTSGFSAGAVEEAKRADSTPVALIDGGQLVTLLIEHGIGVQRTSYDLIELDDPSKAE